MHIASKIAAAAIAGMLCFAPMSAMASAKSEAENLRKLDIMLMVTSLRCRHGADDFQGDYQRFSAKHLNTMKQAYTVLQTDLARQYGSNGAKRQLDRISVGMANQYGQGHPWLACDQLKEVTQQLTATTSRATLLTAADELLASRRPAQFAMLD